MSYLSSRFYKRETKSRRNYEIEDTLYTELEQLASEYDASVSDLINAAISFLVETENIANYVKHPDEITVTHTVLIKQNNLAGLDRLKSKYDISIFKLVNIAIKNLIADERAPLQK